MPPLQPLSLALIRIPPVTVAVLLVLFPGRGQMMWSLSINPFLSLKKKALVLSAWSYDSMIVVKCAYSRYFASSCGAS